MLLLVLGIDYAVLPIVGHRHFHAFAAFKLLHDAPLRSTHILFVDSGMFMCACAVQDTLLGEAVARVYINDAWLHDIITGMSCATKTAYEVRDAAEKLEREGGWLGRFVTHSPMAG